MVGPTPRFYALGDVAEILHISVKQVYALVRRGELPAIKIGGRGQWRVEHTELENYIGAAYRSTRQYIKDHPFSGEETLPELDDELDARKSALED
jgi:excisionase family DNA binding protein